MYTISDSFLPNEPETLPSGSSAMLACDRAIWLDHRRSLIILEGRRPCSRFTLENVFPKYCASKTSTGEYSCLRVELIFKREFWYYLIQYYIPCGMLVIVSWVSFWLDQNAVPARVALGVTTIFTMLIQTSEYQPIPSPCVLHKGIPFLRVIFLKLFSPLQAIDVWVGVCLTFVFGALLEFALVNHASRSEDQREKMKEKVEEQKEMENEVEQGEKGRSAFAMKNSFKTFLSKFPTTSKRIDIVSRIAFPLIFIIFNLAYWSTYLSTDGEDA
ncbi:Glutamate-gated chloride channel [Armadillidium nasatum]|uniref:Glutamate-gated chloride channel n=1 Tax=Armadillidium nasatum TaxID=96803 RepID=A0A5N5TAW9_9CRUS|nr:Glutamate-gated chloride channel [Armadillidium nasatum]